MSRYSEALEMQMKLLDHWGQKANLSVFEEAFARHGIDRGYSSLMVDLTVSALEWSEPYYVNPPICSLLFEAAKSIPTSWVFAEEALYAPSGFAFLSTPLVIPGAEGPVVGFTWADMSWTEEGRILLPEPHDPGTRLLFLSFLEQTEGYPVPSPLSTTMCKRGETLGAALTEAAASGKRPNVMRESLRLFATLMSFLQQRILMAPSGRPDRMARRRVERANSRPVEVRVVSLRNVKRSAGKGEQRDVEWECRWIVRGHWRHQWYPPEKQHRVKWIAPYLKGPEDKPLRDPARLFAVVR